MNFKRIICFFRDHEWIAYEEEPVKCKRCFMIAQTKYKSGCTGKMPFFTKKEALSWIRNSFKSKNVAVYHCRFLVNDQEHWHITSMKKNAFKRIKKRLELMRETFEIVKRKESK